MIGSLEAETLLKYRSRYLVIDVRSPQEFSQGHVPRAINIPLLLNEERHLVGKAYKEQGRSLATALALELFSIRSKQVFKQLEALAQQNKTLLIHCWRGGMRSQSVQKWLKIAGIEAVVLTGGYKQYRQAVLRRLESLAKTPILTLLGNTGSGKTDLLRDLRENSLPTLDFEKLANHRGSLFGGAGLTGGQPSQEHFENLICAEICKLSNPSWVLVEIENAIGNVRVPPVLRKSVANAPMVLVERSLEDRIDRLSIEYTKIWQEDSDSWFLSKMPMLEKFLSNQDYQSIINKVLNRQFCEAIQVLLEKRYDPTYAKSLQRRKDQIQARFNLSKEYDSAKKYLQSYSPESTSNSD